ncbi:MAG: hypothetical protein ACK4UN_08960, partial [Limisphaerales bacterium]
LSQAMKKTKTEPHIPELGEVLKFLLDCFDIRRDGEPLTHKQVERLAKNKGINQETWAKVARSVLDAIYVELGGDPTARGLTAKMLEQWCSDPQSMAGVPVDADGVGKFTKEQALKDAIEFCSRHHFLLASLHDCKTGWSAQYHWLSGFVIPYVCSTLVDYYSMRDNPDSGMPGGWAWYLPKFYIAENGDCSVRVLMPSQQVLLWWEDLLGEDLSILSGELCAVGSDPDIARRQVAAWKTEARPPDSGTIQRWVGNKWQYKGVFEDNESAPLNERWRKCREFLERKGLLGESNWMKGSESSQFEPQRELSKAYRGERLEQEIPPFEKYPVRRFFESQDPIAEGLPVAELIERVAARWRIPTTVELRSRLLIGRALNLAWNKCMQALGHKETVDLMRWASCCYNYMLKLSMEAERVSPKESLRLHQQKTEVADAAFFPIAAMYDEGYWLRLPSYLRMWIEGKVVFNE